MSTSLARFCGHFRACVVAFALFVGVAHAEPAHDFGRTPDVIDIGYGILSTPMSLLGEVMRRDTQLQRAGRAIGLEFRFHRFEKGVDTLSPLLAGLLDASMPTDVVALDAITKSDIVLLGYVRQSFSSVVSARGLSMAALKDKRIGYAPGTSGHHALLQGLASVGLTENDVSLVVMNAREMPDALINGKVHAFAAWEPTPSAFLRKYPGRYGILYRQISPAYFVISRQLAQQQPEAARLLAAALHRAVRWLAKSRANLALASSWTLSEMKVFSGQDSGLGEKDIAALTRSDLLDVAGAPLIPAREVHPDSALGRSFLFFRASGKLPADMDWQRVVQSVDQSINRHVLANPDKYRLSQFDYVP